MYLNFSLVLPLTLRPRWPSGINKLWGGGFKVQRHDFTEEYYMCGLLHPKSYVVFKRPLFVLLVRKLGGIASSRCRPRHLIEVQMRGRRSQNSPRDASKMDVNL
ncbi:hypothetical protein AVEN_231718-1 [Araneus ventricosus]|uniref:Uncharacterized protein n=1 Tax=Araneus ventricosus TaxID=182803 RepID=A0A4Y2UF56_ARAVE|nr:hypothetical protein AVEN_231718-1 [Araneus ventricosus]